MTVVHIDRHDDMAVVVETELFASPVADINDLARRQLRFAIFGKSAIAFAIRIRYVLDNRKPVVVDIDANVELMLNRSLRPGAIVLLDPRVVALDGTSNNEKVERQDTQMSNAHIVVERKGSTPVRLAGFDHKSVQGVARLGVCR